MAVETAVYFSFLVIGFINFLGDGARGVILPILWPLCEELGGDHKDLGYLIALFAGGRLISHIPYGKCADCCRHRLTMMISGLIFLMGSLTWAYTESVHELRILYLAQFLLGLGTGSLGVSRAYVIELTEEGVTRTNRLAHLLSAKYVGLAVTPFLGSASVLIGKRFFDRDYHYAFPAFLLSILGVLWILFLIYPFKNVEETETGRRMKREEIERNEKDKQDNVEDQSESSSLLNRPNQANHRKNYFTTSTPQYEVISNQMQVDLYQVNILMIIFNCLMKGSIGIYETQITRLLIRDYHMDQYHVGLLISLCGIVGTYQLLKFESLYTNHWTPFQLLYGSTLAMILVQTLLIITNYTIYSSPIHLPGQVVRADFLEKFILMFGIFIVFGFGYPIGSTAIVAKYSNLQEYGRQGVHQAIMSVSSSIARIVASIGSSYLLHYRYIHFKEEDNYYNIHNQALSGSVLFLMTVLLLLMIFHREKIISFSYEREKMKSEEHFEFNLRTNRMIIILSLICLSLSIYAIFF